jgi:hypothetical protein
LPTTTDGRLGPRRFAEVVPSRFVKIANVGGTVRRQLLCAILSAVMLGGCTSAGATGGLISWRDLDLEIPVGWVVLDQRADLLFLANEDITRPDDELDDPPVLPADPDSNDVVGVQLTTDSSSTAADWRELVQQEGGTVELDERVEIGGLPATALTFRWVTNGVDTRERVVLVPSRRLVILLQPIPVVGQANAPTVFDAHRAEFDEMLASILWGRPVEG